MMSYPPLPHLPPFEDVLSGLCNTTFNGQPVSQWHSNKKERRRDFVILCRNHYIRLYKIVDTFKGP